MISSVRFCARYTFKRNIRTYYNNFRENSKNREARMLDRMFAKLERKKLINVQTASLNKINFFEHKSNQFISRKGVALNKVYMEHMAELIQSGKHSSKILEEGLEIINVRLTKGGDYINIYWACNNEKLTEEAIGKMLELSAKELQEQMGSIKYVSKTPFVRFVRDARVERMETVAKILKTADFGKDHESGELPEPDATADCNLTENELLEMRQDVFGIDHAKIKSKILTAMEIYKVTHTPKENEFAYVEMENVIPFDKKAFIKFYKRKRILDRKLTARGLFGWRRFIKYEEDDDDDEDSDLANELWKEIKKEQEEEEKEYAKNYEN